MVENGLLYFSGEYIWWVCPLHFLIFTGINIYNLSPEQLPVFLFNFYLPRRILIDSNDLLDWRVLAKIKKQLQSCIKHEELEWPQKQGHSWKWRCLKSLLSFPAHLKSLEYLRRLAVFFLFLLQPGWRPWWSPGQELPLSQSPAAWGRHCPCQCSMEQNAMMPTYRSPPGPDCSTPTSTLAFDHNFTTTARGSLLLVEIVSQKRQKSHPAMTKHKSDGF